MSSKNHIVENWKNDVLKKSLKRLPERRDSFTFHGGRPVPRVGLPKEITADYLEELGMPGVPPFTRGIRPTMYRGRLWTMRQYAGFSSAAETNKRFRYLLKQGQTGLSVAFDLPTQLGYDSDSPLALGEVGRVGVAIDTLADMERLFAHIPLGEISTSMTINAPAIVLLAMYVVAAEKQGVALEELSGTIQNDILKEYIARGTYIFPPEESLRLISDIFSWCAQNTPRFNTISISGYHIREAGATAVQELAFTLANAVTYVEQALAAGLTVEQFAKRISFFFSAGLNLFEEAAKFRAARRMWAKIMKERFAAKDPASQMLRFHCQTAGSELQAQQVDNNIIRVTIQAMSAILGGCQSLHTNSKDEAVSLPSEEAVHLALRTQQILAHESGIADTVDPLAGSYYVEELTTTLEREALSIMADIEADGGMVAAIREGSIQAQIEEAAYTYQRSIENTQRVVVGLNRFQENEKIQDNGFTGNPDIEDEQVKQLQEIKESRDHNSLDQTLKELRQAAEGNGSLMEPMLAAVRAYASVGEICQLLRQTFGTYKP